MSVLKPKLIVQAGAQLDDWGTPAEVLDFVRLTCGPITLDLASNATANKLVKAKRFFSVENPCPSAFTKMPAGTVVWCNPPGPVAEVRRFWDIWQGCIVNSRASVQGAFLIFNLDHLRALSHPRVAYEVVFWRKRLRFVGAPSQYNHPSALVMLTHSGVGLEHGPVMGWM